MTWSLMYSFNIFIKAFADTTLLVYYIFNPSLVATWLVESQRTFLILLFSSQILIR